MALIRGELTGNTRSTPSPKDTLRTIPVLREPLPFLRAMTPPSQACPRVRLPSTTLYSTRMVSPVSNSGMASRMSGCSIERRMAPLLYFIIVSFPGGSTDLDLGASLGAHSLDILAQAPGSLQAPRSHPGPLELHVHHDHRVTPRHGHSWPCSGEHRVLRATAGPA